MTTLIPSLVAKTPRILRGTLGKGRADDREWRKSALHPELLDRAGLNNSSRILNLGLCRINNFVLLE